MELEREEVDSSLKTLRRRKRGKETEREIQSHPEECMCVYVCVCVCVCVCVFVCVGKGCLGGECKASFLKSVFNPNDSLSSKTV